MRELYLSTNSIVSHHVMSFVSTNTPTSSTERFRQHSNNLQTASTGKTDVFSDFGVRERSLHVLQLLLHHGMAHLSLHLSRLSVAGAESGTLDPLAGSGCMCLDARASMTTGDSAPGRRALGITQSRGGHKFVAAGIEADGAHDAAERARALVTGTTPRPSELRPSPLHPTLAHLNRAFDLTLGGNVDPLVTLLPINRTALAKLILENQRVKNAQRLIHRPPNIRIIDSDRANHTLRIDDEQRPLRHALVLDQHAVVAAESVIAIADERDVHATQPALHVRRRVPRFQAVLGVGAGEGDRARAAVEEFFQARAESAHFRRADEGPGFGEEDQN